jgi:hypothetical protein
VASRRLSRETNDTLEAVHRWMLLSALGCAPASEPAPIAGSGDGSGTDPSSDVSSSRPGIEVPAACAYNPDFVCSTPRDCDDVVCGGWNTAYDANGCLRISCTATTDCPADHRCIFALEWGGDTWDEGPCHETMDGTCDCASWHSFLQSYCVPIGEAPSDAATPQQHCAALDEVACASDGLGICSWSATRRSCRL